MMSQHFHSDEAVTPLENFRTTQLFGGRINQVVVEESSNEML